MKNNGSWKAKLLKVAGIEIKVPSTLKMEAFKAHPIPTIRHFATQDNGDMRLRALPIMGTGTIRYQNENGENKVERRVDLALASDKKTYVPMSWLEKTENLAFLPVGDSVSTEQIREATERLIAAAQQMPTGSHT